MTALQKKRLLARPKVKEAVAELRAEFRRGSLSLYLGAGVSQATGLPSWNTLVASLYYTAVDADWSRDWKAYPNYLYALGEWLLKNSGEPPEAAAGKIERYFDAPEDFARLLLETLYLPWRQPDMQVVQPSPDALRRGNPLLTAVAELCEASTGSKGLHAVVSTNYDSLLERAIERGPAADLFRPLWNSATVLPKPRRGIFHVHGYLPAAGKGSEFEEILLTEAHYHGAASDPYSWSNLTLLQCFSASTGLMVGMSMTDRNLRRLLHALSTTQLRREMYVILREPKVPTMTTCDVDAVQEKAGEYAARFSGSGLKRGGKPAHKMQMILQELVAQEKAMAEKTFGAMGVTPLWVRDYPEIPVILEAIRRAT